MTDIEGSTRLFRELGDAYLRLLAEHEELLSNAFRAHRGVEVETEGDALLVAFADAADAVAGCLEGQRALAAHRWPAGGEVRVRMGVHTGEASPVGHRYVALALHQVARICAAAHGGQIVLSETTANAARGGLPAVTSLASLGSFQLRGFPTPERLLQVWHPDLRRDFPPLRALGVVVHNLPFLRASFVGRSKERSQLAGLLATTGVVTLVGPAGVGKTRLAVQVTYDVVDTFADGAWLAELAPLTDPALVPQAVARAIRVTEQPGRDVEDVLVEALASKSALLLLDNCEHVLDAAAGLAGLLSQHCPHLVILATSREPLDIEGEVVWRVGPLATVDPSDVRAGAEPAHVDAIRLFVERAAMIRPEFRLTDQNAPDVARIVHHLDGIPLAIELAAAALGDRPLSAVVEGLADRFSLLSRGRRTAPSRHQTLRAALEWSLDLLDPDERRLFARLAAFAGSGTVEAAADVCGGPPLTGTDVPPMLRRLVRSSLLVSHPEIADRWSMLESARELAALELASAREVDEVAARFRAWNLRRLEEVQDVIGRKGGAEVMRTLASDHDNIRRAIETAVGAGDAESALRICTAMAPFWMSHGDWTEGSERLLRALALPSDDERLRGRALVAVGNILLLRGDLAAAEKQFEAARERGEAFDDDLTLARALSGAGYIAFRRSHLAQAEALWEEALGCAERAGDNRTGAGILRSLAAAAATAGGQQAAGALLDRALEAARRAEDDQLVRMLYGSLAERHLWLGRYELAAAQYGDALSLASEIGDLSARPLLLAEIGWVALLKGDVATAERLSVDAAELAEDLGNRRVLAHALRLRGEALVRQGRTADAADVLERALAEAEALGAPAEVAGVVCSQACVALEQLDLAEARRLAAEARGALPHPMRRVSPDWVLGVVALIRGDLETADGHFGAVLELAEHAEAPRYRANGIWGYAAVSAARGLIGEAAKLQQEALMLRREIGDRLGVADSLVGMAAAVVREEPEAAARLIGAASALRSRAGVKATQRESAEVGSVLGAAVSAFEPRLVLAAETAGLGLDEEAAASMARDLSAQLVARLDDADMGRQA